MLVHSSAAAFKRSAGVEGAAPAADITDEEWDRVFAVNAKAPSTPTRRRIGR
jgi:NAD(P)-dependent dehydrogenase (short-subunit alcohol dehydrogenase family)